MNRTRKAMLASSGAVVAMSAALFFYSDPRTPPTSKTSHTWLDGIARAAVGTAEAAACADVGGQKVRRKEQIWEPRKSTSAYGSEEWFVCTWDGSGSDPVADAVFSTVYEPNTVTTFCDGTFLESNPGGGGNRVCKSPHANCGAGQPFSNPYYGTYCSDAAPADILLECASSNCPEPEPCCKDDETDCRDCGGNPVSLVGGSVSEPIGQGGLFYQLKVADLPVGFTPLRIFLYSQSIHESTNLGGPIGLKASHSLAPALFYREGKIKVTTEEGGFFNFTLVGSVWTADDGRVATLVRNGVSCTGTLLLTLGNGTKYTFSETGPSPCSGTAVSEGRIQQIVRPNGETLTFSPDAQGYPSVVENRLGERVTLVNGPEGTLEKIELRRSSSSAPYSQFKVWYSAGQLGAVTTSNGTGVLFNLEYETQTANNRKLKKITNAAETRLAEWTYINDGFDNRVLTEKGRGDATTGDDQLDFGYDVANGASTIVFRDSQGTPRQNLSSYVPGTRPRVTDRTNAGSCPGCGTTDKVRYVPSRAWPSARENANAFVDTFSNHDLLGNPQTVRKGCDGTVGSPSCTPGSFRELSYLYQTATRVVKEESRPSAISGTVTDRRTFDGASTRVLLDKKEGKTAANIGDLLNVTKIRTTKTTYCKEVPGECPTANDLDVRRIEGPYDDALGPADSPKVEYAYYSATDADCGTGGVLAENTNRVKTITRWVSSSRSLVTKYCLYTANGKPTKVVAPSNVITTFTFGDGSTQSPTQVKLDDGGLPLTTDFKHDAEGRVIAVKLPRTNGSGNRVGFTYTLDAKAQVKEIAQGQFASGAWSIASPQQKLIYEYDAWGNRTKTRWVDSLGADRVTEGAQYDSFNRLACAVRPYPDIGSTCAAATQKTTYEYDPEGALIAVRDAQNDEILYGSLATFSKQNRYGQIEKTQQSACNHPVGQENSPCAAPTPTPASVAYEYDAALQLKRVTVSDAIRNGQMVTDYVEDDFGKLVKIASPDSGNSFFVYDGFGRLYESQDARQAADGFKVRYTYDRQNRLTLTEKVVAGSPTALVKFCYDAFDAVCGFTDSQYAYNRGRLSSVDDGAGKIKYEYDRYGRLVREDRTWNSGAVYTTQYAYDGNGNLTATTLPHGVVLNRSYNDADQPSAVTYSAPGLSAQALVGTISWLPFGGIDNWHRLTNSSPRWWVMRDTAGRVIETKMTNASGGSVYFSDTYGYANDGNVLKSPASENPPRILHDSLGRLQQDRFGTSSTQTYAYDHAGNRTSRVAGIIYTSTWVGASSPSTLTNKLDTVTWQTDGVIDYNYNADGSVYVKGYRPNNGLISSTSLTYSDEGLVNSAITTAGTTNYVRDFRGLRVGKTGAGGVGNFTFDASGQLIGWQGPASVLSCGGARTKTIVPHEAFLWLDGRPIAIIKTHTETSTSGCAVNAFVVDGVFYYYTEKMGLPRVVTKWTSGLPVTVWGPATWDAFANPLTTIAEDPDGDGKLFTVPFRLPGQFALGTLEGGPTTSTGGLHDNWFRTYDSETGRYLQSDPVVTDTRRSPYTYAANKPLRLVDPNGLRFAPGPLIELIKPAEPVRAPMGEPIPGVGPRPFAPFGPGPVPGTRDDPNCYSVDENWGGKPYFDRRRCPPPPPRPESTPDERQWGCRVECEDPNQFPWEGCKEGPTGSPVFWEGEYGPWGSDHAVVQRDCRTAADFIETGFATTGYGPDGQDRVRPGAICLGTAVPWG